MIGCRILIPLAVVLFSVPVIQAQTTTLNYPWGLRGYQNVYEYGGYNHLVRAFNWHPISAVDRTNGTASSPSTLLNGEIVWDFLASGMTPGGVNDAHSAMRIRVDGVPSGNDLELRTQFFEDTLVVRSSGNVGINEPFPIAPLFVKTNGPGAVGLYGSNYNLGVTTDIASGRSGYIAYTSNDWLNGAGNNAHFLSLYPFDIDSAKNGDRQWKAFRLRVGASAEDKFWVNVYGEGYFQGKLEVENTIRSKEVIVESSGWPDYVFEDGYDLPTLDEVELHIEENGHLPGVDPAEEINSRGQSLGETQRLMMEKIEELTLYLIQVKNEKDEEIARLNETVENLKERFGEATKLPNTNE